MLCYLLFTALALPALAQDRNDYWWEDDRERRGDQHRHRIDKVLQPQGGERCDDADS